MLVHSLPREARNKSHHSDPAPKPAYTLDLYILHGDHFQSNLKALAKVINEPASHHHSTFSQILTVASHRDNKKYYEPRGRIFIHFFGKKQQQLSSFCLWAESIFRQAGLPGNRSFDTSSAA